MATFTPNTFEQPITKILGLVPASWPYIHLREAPPTTRIEGNQFLRISTPALRPIGPPLPVIAEEEDRSGPNNNLSHGPALPQTTSTSSRRPRRVRHTPCAYISQPHEIDVPSLFFHPHELQRFQQFLNELATSNYLDAEDLESTSQ